MAPTGHRLSNHAMMILAAVVGLALLLLFLLFGMGFFGALVLALLLGAALYLVLHNVYDGQVPWLADSPTGARLTQQLNQAGERVQGTMAGSGAARTGRPDPHHVPTRPAHDEVEEEPADLPEMHDPGARETAPAQTPRPKGGAAPGGTVPRTSPAQPAATAADAGGGTGADTDDAAGTDDTGGTGASEVEARPEADRKSAPAVGASAVEATPDAPADHDGEGTRPDLLDAPRGGSADDLKRIKGVGPKLESVLNEMGVYHFDQIAAWGPDEVAYMDRNVVGFKGRVSRDEWVAQARELARED